MGFPLDFPSTLIYVKIYDAENFGKADTSRVGVTLRSRVLRIAYYRHLAKDDIKSSCRACHGVCPYETPGLLPWDLHDVLIVLKIVLVGQLWDLLTWNFKYASGPLPSSFPSACIRLV